MPSFSKKVSLPGKTAETLYEVISRDIDKFLNKTPLGQYDLKRDEQNKQISFKASMASGTLTAKEGELQLELSLSLLAAPFKSKIDEGIEKWLAKTFG